MMTNYTEANKLSKIMSMIAETNSKRLMPDGSINYAFALGNLQSMLCDVLLNVSEAQLRILVDTYSAQLETVKLTMVTEQLLRAEGQLAAKAQRRAAAHE